MSSSSLTVLCCLMACVGSFASGEEGVSHQNHEKYEHAEQEHTSHTEHQESDVVPASHDEQVRRRASRDDHHNDEHAEHDDHDDHDEHANHDEHDDDRDHRDDHHDGEHAEHDDHDDHDEHDDHDDHDDHDETNCTKYPWKWSGIFPVSKGHFAWNAARKQGSYAEPSMRILLLSAADAAASLAQLKAFQTQALAAWPTRNWTKRTSGQELAPGFAYNLTFDPHSWISVFPVDVESSGALVIFAEHDPAEFEDGFHFFRNEGGADVEAAAQGSADPCDAGHGLERKDNWAIVILGAFITCTPTLLGVLFVSCAVKPRLQRLLETLGPCVDSFASGVLIAAAVFLLLPEALHLASVGHDSEVVGTWTWGTSIMLGWLTCSIIHHVCAIMFAKQLEQQAKGEVDVEKNNSAATLTRSWQTIAGPVIFGDFFHNLTDGFVIGAAFQNCSQSFAWKLVAVTVCHELPQEIADFFLLINDAGMRWHWATLANFLSSLSTVLGATITYGSTVGSNEEGYILAYGAGVYLFIAMTELGPKVVHLEQANLAAVVKRLVPFALGCIAIGLVLTSHEHCDKALSDATIASTSGAHAGHGH